MIPKIFREKRELLSRLDTSALLSHALYEIEKGRIEKPLSKINHDIFVIDRAFGSYDLLGLLTVKDEIPLENVPKKGYDSFFNTTLEEAIKVLKSYNMIESNERTIRLTEEGKEYLGFHFWE